MAAWLTLYSQPETWYNSGRYGRSMSRQTTGDWQPRE